MVFPTTILGTKVELKVGGTFTDITAYAMSRDQPTNAIQISRGKRNESSTADPAVCLMQLNNRDGRFSPRNPMGPYSGQIGRNSEVRVSVPGSAYLAQVTATDYCSTPDSVATSITGDLEVHVDLDLDNWANGSQLHMIGKWNSTGNQQSWALNIGGEGKLYFYNTTDGTTGPGAFTSTIPVPPPFTGRKAIKATLDVNNGAGGCTVTFYTADYEGATWVQLGAAVTNAGTTSIYNSTAATSVGSLPAVRIGAIGKYYSFSMYNGIGGAAVCSPVFYGQTALAATITDAQGNTWTPNGSTLAVDYRFWGEVESWPQAWDQTVTDRYVNLSAYGVLRRLGGLRAPLRSAFYRGCTSKVSPVTSLVAYWPMEDSIGSSSIAAGVGRNLMTWTGKPTLASDSTFVCSGALPVVGSAVFTGKVSSAATTQAQVSYLMAMPDTGTTNLAILLSVQCSGTANTWNVYYGTGGGLYLNVYAADGTVISLNGPYTFGVDGTHRQVVLSMKNNGGGGIDWVLSTLNVGAHTGGSIGATIAANSISGVTQVTLNATGNSTGVTMGHVTVQNTVPALWSYWDLISGYTGETAGARLTRLCTEEGITLKLVGVASDTVAMGPQRPMAILDLLRECETADQGVLFDSRDANGITYRTRTSLYNQPSGLDLSFTGGDLSSFTPVDDTQTVTNDVTSDLTYGSSARVTLDGGALSTQPPPAGIGPAPISVAVNLASDNQAPMDAGWRLALGTVDEARYPAIGIQTARVNFSGSAMRTSLARRLDIGSRLVVSSFPTGFPPDPVEQIAVGLTETLGQFAFDISALGVPASPYRVTITDTASSRYDGSRFTTTNGTTTSGSTTLHVWNRDKIPWSVADGNVEITVAGEKMTITAVADESGVAAVPLNANPYFNTPLGITDWYSPTGSTIAAEAGTVHEGNGSIKMTTVAVADNRIECNAFWIRVNNEPDYLVGSFAVRGWLRCTSAVSCSVRINWYADGLVFIGSSPASSVLVANTWTSFGWGVDAPSNAVYANIGAGVDGSPGAGIVLYADELTLARYLTTQALTVTRSANNVVKAHGDNEVVSLFRPVKYGI